MSKFRVVLQHIAGALFNILMGVECLLSGVWSWRLHKFLLWIRVEPGVAGNTI